ncbi:hypothetical protein F383_26612 [Gossypium arboreum]|uniref:Uncharacterized protein n=1 Tax=Gossypium arboreum TaxID=29729 RepID=A0A0B0MM32_GOSAR|nr:hypothetical protein F383_26612 [Gossypium arboreum]
MRKLRNSPCILESSAIQSNHILKAKKIGSTLGITLSENLGRLNFSILVYGMY